MSLPQLASIKHCSCSPLADLRRIRIRFRPEITQNHQVFDRARVFERDTRTRSRLRTKCFVFGHFHEPDHLRTIEGKPVYPSVALNHDQTVSAFVLDSKLDNG